MNALRSIVAIALANLVAASAAFAATPVPGADPLAAIDLNRAAIIADIVQGFEGDRTALAKRLSGLRADRLLSASLASTRESLESILVEAEKSRDAAVSRAGAKVLGSASADLVYTPLTPCRLVDTRGFGAPIQGGVFSPNERRAYVPNGLCGLPVTSVASMLVSFTTENLTPNSGGYLAILGPAAPVTASVDVFNLGAEWSASNTAVITGPAAQFDVLVAAARAHVVIDILGYFAPPQGTIVKSITAGTGLTGGTITDTGTVGIAAGFQLPQACTNGQVAQSNGVGAWTCATPVGSGGTLTGVTASAPIVSSGGNTPNISLAGGAAGQILVGTAGAPTWSSSPSISGNLVLPDPSTAGGGTIMKGGSTFIHNFGTANTFVGKGAGNFTMTGLNNTAIGLSTLALNVSGSGNTASGVAALVSNTTGSGNTASGLNALISNTSGANNTASGFNALYSNKTANSNTASGFNALFNNTSGANNTASGVNALYNNTTASGNTASGFNALYSNTTASGNTASGFNALYSNTTGILNTASGANALQDNTTGNANTATGSNALQNNTTGTLNTAHGTNALLNNTTGTQNTAVGKGALLLSSTGTRNTAIGIDALAVNTTGSNNVAIGDGTMAENTTGSYNIAIGHLANNNAATGDFNIHIGSFGGVDTGTIRIGDSLLQQKTYIAGIRGITTALSAIPVYIDGADQLGTISSSRRVKDDIADMDAESGALMKLRPVTFHYKADQNPAGRTLQYGLIAEEVEEVYPGLVAYSRDGQVETVMYQFLPPMLLNEVQKQQRTIDAQAAEIAELKRFAAEVRRLLPNR